MARASIDTAGWTWSAVAAGVVAALVVQVLLTMLGIGIGLVTVGPDADPNSISWAAFAWWAIAGIIAAFIGGWVAGAFSPTEDNRLRAAGALTTWAIATLIVVVAVGFTAGTTATVAGSLGGPVASTGARVDALTRDGARETTGQAAARPSPALEQARRQFAAVALASFVALLIGAAAAFVGGTMAPVMPGRPGGSRTS